MVRLEGSATVPLNMQKKESSVMEGETVVNEVKCKMCNFKNEL